MEQSPLVPLTNARKKDAHTTVPDQKTSTQLEQFLAQAALNRVSPGLETLGLTLMKEHLSVAI